MNDEEIEAKIKTFKEEHGLTGESTHYMRGLGLGNLTIIRGGWRSRDIDDVRKLLELDHIVACTGERTGIYEVGYNNDIGKYVGVHHINKTVDENPSFKDIEEVLEWFSRAIKITEDCE